MQNSDPRTAAAAVNKNPSTSAWSTRRRFPAPMATRRASSRPRDAPRASSRFATFAHAISSTRPTIAPSTHSAVWLPWRRSERPVAPGRNVNFACTYQSRNAFGVSDEKRSVLRSKKSVNTGCIRARACSRVTPSLRRPRILNQVQPGSVNDSTGVFIVAGIQSSVMLPGSTPLKPCWMTPTT